MTQFPARIPVLTLNVKLGGGKVGVRLFPVHRRIFHGIRGFEPTFGIRGRLLIPATRPVI